VGGRRPGIHHWWLFGILTIGLGLRLWGITFGLPNVNCRPDESLLVHKALAIASGDLNPHFFNYPSFQFYLLALLFGLYFAAGWVFGAFADVQQFEVGFFTDPSAFYLLGRALSALIGVGSVAMVYLLGRGMGGTRAGLLSAAFLATAFLHVRDSHFLTADVPATFHLLVALVFTWRYIDRARPASMLLAAVFFGFAVSTKYNIALIVPSGLLAVWLVARSAEGGSDRRPLALWRHVFCAVAVIAISFAATSPYVLLDFPTFLRDFQYEQAHFSRGHGLDLGTGWVYHLRVTLFYGLGWPLAVVSVGACLWLARRRERKDLVLLTGILLYYLVAGAGRSVFFRYMIPLVPLLCLAAGVWLSHLSPSVRGRWVALAALVLMIPGTTASLHHNRILATVDTRLQAAEWIGRELPAGTKIAMVGTDYGFPQVHRTRAWLEERLSDVRQAGLPGRRLARQLALDGLPPKPDYYVVELRPDNPLHLRSVWNEFSLDDVRSAGIDWVVVQEHPLTGSGADRTFLTRLEVEAALTCEFNPFEGRSGSGSARFDPIDAYYVPYAGFADVRRPGPKIRIYNVGNGDGKWLVEDTR
jgi:hypothetical protein